jgi:DNA-binding MarR family transcriptional regulator
MSPAFSTGEGDREALVAALIEELGSWSAAERREAFEEWLRRSVSLTHLLVLAILDTRGPIAVSRLAGVLDVSVPSATGIVSRLEKGGLATRIRGAATDLRIVQVEITDEGRRILDELGAQQHRYLERLLDAVAAEDLRIVLEAARILKDARVRLGRQEADGMMASGAGKVPAGPERDRTEGE